MGIDYTDRLQYYGYEDDEYYSPDNWQKGMTRREMKKKTAPRDVHVPNSKEGKLLRQLMSTTGLNEKEIREHKKYRKQLAEARASKGPKSPLQRMVLNVMKDVTSELKLPIEHPKVIEAFKQKILKLANEGYGHRVRSLQTWSISDLVTMVKQIRKKQRHGNQGISGQGSQS